jgi:type IX secretion system PorP/SprF family membrane protein
MLKVLPFALLLFISRKLTAQETGPYYRFQNNYILSNPAFSGAGHQGLISLSGAMQNFSPGNHNSDGSILLDKKIKEKTALHTSVSAGSNFIHSNKTLMLGGGYQVFNTKKNVTLNIGFSAGIYLKQLNKNMVLTDSSGNSTNISVNPQPTINAGLLIQSPRWAMGYSATQINQPTFRQLNNYVVVRQHHLILGYRTNIRNNWSFEPSILGRFTNEFISTRINIPFEYKEKLHFSFGVDKMHFTLIGRKIYSYGITAGFAIQKRIQFSYSTILTSSELTPTNYFLHQLNLSYLIK